MKYLYLFLTATGIYVLFLLRGLHNNHYLDWTTDFQIADCIEIMLFTVPLVYFSLKLFSRKQDFLKDSLWFAFCTSVPFFMYDFLYLGVMKNYGLGHLRTFWFLTIFYFIVWVEIPLIGYLMQKRDPAIARKHLLMLAVAVVLWCLNYWEGSVSGHFLSWSLNMKINRLVNAALILFTVVIVLLKLFSQKADYLKDAGFFTVYVSFVFIVFDYFYLGISKGNGAGYIHTYWFVALFYPLFWIETPLIGWLMQRRSGGA